MIKKGVSRLLCCGVFLSATVACFGQTNDLYLNSPMDPRIGIVYGPEAGDLMVPFPKIALQYYFTQPVLTYAGAAIEAGNVLVLVWGSASVYAGVQYDRFFAETVWTQFHNFPPGPWSGGPEDPKNLYYWETSVNPRIGYFVWGPAYVSLGPQLWVVRHTNDADGEHFKSNYPFINLFGARWNLEIGVGFGYERTKKAPS